MRYLICDDDQAKIDAIRQALQQFGVVSGDIFEAKHAAGARAVLSAHLIDVLFLDILLPARANSTPSGEVSLDLAMQIIDDGAAPAPRHIVGVTADIEALRDYESSFRKLLLLVLHIAPGQDEWKSSVESLVKHNQRLSDHNGTWDYDICILDALRHPELDAVYASWPANLGPELLIDNNLIVRKGTLEIEGRSLRAVFGHLPLMGPIAATHTAGLYLHLFKPRLLLMTGICGGIGDEIAVGDLVAADISWDWQAGKWTDDWQLATALDQCKASRELVGISQIVESRLDKIYNDFSGQKPNVKPKLVIAPMVSGSSVVASTDIHKVFRKQHRKVTAVDMECYGLYYACERASAPRTEALCIKSVSDLSNRGKSDDYQAYCSHLSASLAFEVVREYFSRLKG